MSKQLKIVLFTLVMAIPGLIAIIPFYQMIVMSTHNTAEIYKGYIYLPGTHTLENLINIYKSGFIHIYWNSLYISVIATAAGVFISTLTGFALAKYEFKLRKTIYFFIIGTMMIPGQLGLVAFIVEMKFFHLNNTHFPLVIVFCANAFGVFWMTQFIKANVPTEVIESARIDGCPEFIIFIKIVIPYIKSAVIALAMLIFLWSWNNYLLPLIVLNSEKLYTVPLGLSKLNNGLYGTDQGQRFAVLSIGTLPLILLFTFGSNYFTRGLVSGALKG
jgi:ABC-type glycerol-3-phosphate transport system permease component